MFSMELNGAVKVMSQGVLQMCLAFFSTVGTVLLKWSYGETNYTFPNVFSAWADLDAGFSQLLQDYVEEVRGILTVNLPCL